MQAAVCDLVASEVVDRICRVERDKLKAELARLVETSIRVKKDVAVKARCLAVPPPAVPVALVLVLVRADRVQVDLISIPVRREVAVRAEKLAEVKWTRPAELSRAGMFKVEIARPRVRAELVAVPGNR